MLNQNRKERIFDRFRIMNYWSESKVFKNVGSKNDDKLPTNKTNDK